MSQIPIKGKPNDTSNKARTKFLTYARGTGLFKTELGHGDGETTPDR